MKSRGLWLVGFVGLGATSGSWGKGPEVESSADDAVAEESGWDLRFRQRVDLDGTVLWADGLTLSEQSIRAKLTSDPFDFSLTIAHGRSEVDYEPGIFGFAERLEDDQWRFTGEGRYQLAPHWNALGTVGYYEGFTDYRSLWISRYYHQLFQELPAYISPSPKGFNFSAGLEWEYIPVMAKVRVTGGYGEETIAPAYDIIDGALERSRPNLYSHFVQLQTENVLTKRLVLQNTARYSSITNREKRWTFQSSANYALLDNLFLRVTAGGAVEQPTFDAYHVGGSLEYKLADEWFIRLVGRFYEDTGEIENSLGGFNTSAPGLESFELGLGLRWQGVSSSLNFYVGYYETDFEPLAEDNQFLTNLYRDRRWGIAQLSFTHNF